MVLVGFIKIKFKFRGKKMKKYISSGLALSVIVALAGCGGGGGSSTPPSSQGTTTSGTASDGYLSGSTVCLDLNNNGSCDSGEPVTITDAKGAYSLKIPQSQEGIVAQAKPSLLVSGGIDIDSKAALVGTLRAPFTSQAQANITPLSTMAQSLVKNGMSADNAYKKVADVLGLTESEVKADPVKLAKENNKKVIATTMALNRIVTTLSNVDQKVKPDAIYDSIGDALAKASDANKTKQTISSLVEAAAKDPKSMLPTRVKEAAVVAPVIEEQVTKAVSSQKSLSDAALVSDAVVNTVQEKVQEALDSNTTLNSEAIAASAKDTADSVDVVAIAIENLFSAYHITLTEAQAKVIEASGFTSSDEINVADILKNNYTDQDVKQLVEELATAYTKEGIKDYVTALGFVVDEAAIAKIASLKNPGFSPDMSKADFSKMIYSTNDADLMKLALEIAPPPGYADMSDIQKAKELFSSVRTQVNSVSNSKLTGYTDKEAVKINDSLNNIAINTELLSKFMDGFSDHVSDMMENNQTALTYSVGNGKRTIHIEQSSTSSDVTYAYDMNQSDGTHWKGSVTYPDIDPDTFDPSDFTTLHAKLNGDLPRDFDETVKGKQTVAADFTITKTSTGADFALSASIESNGDSVSISDAKATVAYTTQDAEDGTKEPVPTYVKLNDLYIDGTVGNYTLSGKLDVNAYTQNKLMAKAGGFEIETTKTWFGNHLYCDQGDIQIDANDNNYTIVYNNKEYAPSQWNIDSSSAYFGYEIKGADIQPTDITYNYTVSCTAEDANLNQDIYTDQWTDDDPNNSGYLPSDISFKGKLSNNADKSYFEGSISAKWVDVANADLDNEDYIAKLKVAMKGALQMPESPLMSVSLSFDNTSKDSVIDTTYVYDKLSVTSHSVLDPQLENGTVNVSASTGVKATLKLVNDEIDYKDSTLTNADGDTLGTFVDLSGVPTIRYVDGSFESLP
jgi:predicted small lipoprotein YifL